MRSVDNLVRLANRFERIVKRAQIAMPEEKITATPTQDGKKDQSFLGEQAASPLKDVEFSYDKTKIMELQKLLNEYFKSKNISMSVVSDGLMGPATKKAIEYAKNNIQSEGGGIMYSNYDVLNYLKQKKAYNFSI